MAGYLRSLDDKTTRSDREPLLIGVYTSGLVGEASEQSAVVAEIGRVIGSMLVEPKKRTLGKSVRLMTLGEIPFSPRP